MRIAGFLIAILIASPEGFALADSYAPYPDQRVVDTKGRYYVVVERPGGPKHADSWGPVNLTIAERRPGTEPVKAARAVVEPKDGAYVMTKNTDVIVRDGDTIHGRIKLEHPPKAILVSSTGRGVALIDYYGVNFKVLEGVDTVRLLSLKGDIRYAKKLSDLLTPEEIWRYDNRTGSVWWLGGGWIDDVDGEIVIVGSNYNLGQNRRPIMALSFDTGKIRRGGAEDVLRAIARKDSQGLEFALELALEDKLQHAKPHLPALLANEQLPLSCRLRAAVLLAEFGDKSGAALMSKTALMAHRGQLYEWEKDYDKQIASAVGYAVDHLSDVLGEEALPVLRDVSAKYGNDRLIAEAFGRLGETAVPTLIAMLSDPRDARVRYVAAEALWHIGPRAKAAVPALVKALGDNSKTPDGYRIDSIAASALGQIGPDAKAALPALAKLAQDPDDWVRKQALEAIQLIQKKN